MAVASKMVFELTLSPDDDTTGPANFQRTLLETLDGFLVSGSVEMSSSGLGGVEIYVAVRAPGTVGSLVSGVFLLIVPSLGDAIRLSEYAVAKRLAVTSKPRRW